MVYIIPDHDIRECIFRDLGEYFLSRRKAHSYTLSILVVEIKNYPIKKNVLQETIIVKIKKYKG